MKRIFALMLSLLFVFSFSACAGEDEEGPTGSLKGNQTLLRICNWEDYIFEDEETEETLYEQFETWYEEEYGVDITIEYSTFGTNEILYNNLKINPGCYDLICPSDYMIQKMLAEDMLDKYDDIQTSMPNYYNYASGYMKDLFEDYGWTEYAIPYMWGTLGFIYNPEFVSHEDAATWQCSVNDAYFNKTTIKDSVRDTYFLGVALANLDELSAKNTAYSNGTLSKEAYADYLKTVFNDTSKEMTDKVETILKKAKENAFALEVDSGKDDMVTGKVWINYAWSGDAVYAMDEAESIDETYLYYSVPEEGSNIWFDGWVMPKGANKHLAQAFLDYISEPTNAYENMYYIGYTSAIAGQYVFDKVIENYGCDPEDEGAEAVDLSYFFNNIEGDAIVYVNERNRQFDAQYPNEDIVARCAIMQYFDDDANERINNMWNRVKAGDIRLYVIVICVVLALIAIAVAIIYLSTKNVFKPYIKKGYKRIK